VKLAKMHPGESFIGCDDPLEAMVFFSVSGDD
jgi:hypothetical protein